jgi:hypothetical protein
LKDILIPDRDKRFFFSTAFRPAPVPAQPPIQWGSRVLSPGVKWLRHEADHSPPSSEKVKNGEAIPLFSPTGLYGAYLIKQKDIFTFF